MSYSDAPYIPRAIAPRACLYCKSAQVPGRENCPNCGAGYEGRVVPIGEFTPSVFPVVYDRQLSAQQLQDAMNRATVFLDARRRARGREIY